MRRTIEDVIETLKDMKKRKKKCAVLIGAGCSKTAGIPTANEFVELIKDRYPREYERADAKTYSQCMSNLSTDQQRDLIAEYIFNAKINWGHIALSQLMLSGYIDRVLTTNFDSLLVRACALLGQFPAIYDFAVSDHFKPEKIQGQAVFYLHGQHTGFILINTQEKSAEHRKLFESIFEDTARNRAWLVVGYSGENDPVFEQLASVSHFDNRLFWIGYQDAEPAQHVRQHLLVEGKDAYYVNGYDADSFFVTVARELGCFPPDFVRKPFTYLENTLADLSPYEIPRFSSQINFLVHTQRFVKNAIALLEPVHEDVLEGWGDYLGGNYEKVIALQEKYPVLMPPEIKEVIALSYIKQGDELVDQALARFSEMKNDK